VRIIIGLTLALSGFAAVAADTATYLLEISHTRPPCSGAAGGMPVAPNDPGAITAPGGERRCYGTRPAVFALQLPENRLVWLEHSAPNPAAWIAVGPVLVDPAGLEAPPLGLRLRSNGATVLETRYGSAATLTPLEPGRWQEVRTADGRLLWMRLVESGRQ